MSKLSKEEQVAILDSNLMLCWLIGDICFGCNGDLNDPKDVLIPVTVQRGEKVYKYVGTTICGACAKAQDYNRVKKGLGYWLSEGHLEVLRDVS